MSYSRPSEKHTFAFRKVCSVVADDRIAAEGAIRSTARRFMRDALAETPHEMRQQIALATYTTGLRGAFADHYSKTLAGLLSFIAPEELDARLGNLFLPSIRLAREPHAMPIPSMEYVKLYSLSEKFTECLNARELEWLRQGEEPYSFLSFAVLEKRITDHEAALQLLASRCSLSAEVVNLGVHAYGGGIWEMAWDGDSKEAS